MSPFTLRPSPANSQSMTQSLGQSRSTEPVHKIAKPEVLLPVFMRPYMVLLDAVVQYFRMGNIEVGQAAKDRDDHVVKDDSMDNRVFEMVFTFVPELLQSIWRVKICHEAAQSNAQLFIRLLFFMSLV